MEVENQDPSLSGPQPRTSSDAFRLTSDEVLKAKTSLRLNYEAQVEVIRRQIGGLEGARQTLGLSQRKMSQLLLVDPSAWTRWIKDGEKAPPHIFRALQWYLSLQEKIPGLTNEYFIGPRSSDLEANLEVSRQSQIGLELRLRDLEKSVGNLRRLNLILGIASLGLSTGLLILVFKQFLIH